MMNFFSVRVRWAAARILLVIAVFLLSSCAGLKIPPDDALERGHQQVGMKIADLVDDVDNLFGEPRVEDLQRKIKIELGTKYKLVDQGDNKLRGKFRARIPLPALERKANAFLDIGGGVRSDAEFLGPALDEYDRNVETSLQYISVRRWPFSLGAKFTVQWHQGPQPAIKPFLRWEGQRDRWRAYLDQEVSYSTEYRWGEITTGHLDYILGDNVYLRVFTEGGTNQEIDGFDMNHALLFRQSLGEFGALSYETGVLYNTDETKGGKTYAQIKLVHRIWRKWLELELKPRANFPWGTDVVRYSLMVGLTVIFEEYLRPAANGILGNGDAPAKGE